VIRLQRKILDLESKNAALQSELDSATPMSLAKHNQDPSKWLPRSPARHTFQSHRLPVTCVAFHPVFSSIASGSEDMTIKIWDWEVGELERTIKAHTKPVLDVDFGGPRGGPLLASCSSDTQIKLWDPAEDYKNVRTLPGHDHSVSAVRFVPSGLADAPLSSTLLASASRDQTIRIWDVTTGFCVRTLRGHSDWVRDVAPSFDGRWLLSAGNDKAPRLWDLNTGDSKVVFLGHEHVVECCVVAPPTAYPHLATLAGLKKAPASTSSVEFVATGGRDKLIKIWDARGSLIRTLVGHDNWIRALVFHPGGRYLLSVSDDKTMRCWDLTQDGKCVKTLEDAHGHFVTSLRWAPSTYKGAASLTNSTNGHTKDSVAANGMEETIRCMLATGSVDLHVRIFAT